MDALRALQVTRGASVGTFEPESAQPRTNHREKVLSSTSVTQPRTTPENAGSGDHIPALDGLRGVAILFVILFHYVTASNFGSDAGVTRKIVGLAGSLWTGVDLFFVLSGFLITGILLRAKDQPGYFTNFYMRRVLRIFPLYYAALIAIFVVVPRLVTITDPQIQRIYDTQGWIWAYSENIAIAVAREDYFNVGWLWVGHFWSLAVEEHFYLVWPLMVFLCTPRTLMRWSLGLMIATPLLRIAMLASHVYYGSVFTLTCCRMDELVLGAVVALLARDPNNQVLLTRYARYGLVGSLAYLVPCVLVRGRALDYTHWSMLGLGFSALTVAFASVLVFTLTKERTLLKRALEMRGLRFFGKYSYGAYVFHTPMQPIYLLLFPPQRIADATRGLGHSGSRVVGLLGFTALGLAITMFLAVASYWLFERHFLKLKKYFEYGARPTPAPAAAVVAVEEAGSS
jgi:peptidoglycan/LPS O-acetylase OafA/YrhL